MRLALPYGRTPLTLDLGARPASVLVGPPQPAAPSLSSSAAIAALIDVALAAPIDRPPLASIVASGARVTVIVSDASRAEPRAEFLARIRHHLPDVSLTLAIATGTHGPTDLAALGLTLPATVVNHDGHAPRDLVDLGTTAHGTPMRVHRCVVDTDLVIATGCIQPHYFAGWSAGVKAVFPGLGEATAIRTNHTLKTAPRARAGIVDGNPCRADLEEAVAMLPAPLFLLNGVTTLDHALGAVVAGDPITAHRAGVAIARPWYTPRAFDAHDPTAPRAVAPADLVIASDVLPVTASLYQAAKIAAAMAPLVAPGGTLALVAECADGIGPLDVVNEAIFRIGVLPRLAPGVTLRLVSSLPSADVASTLLTPATLPALLDEQPGRILVVPRASQLILEAS
jgi:nickel-dependent lactate racemase